jgi:hypothetical protein
MNKDSGLLAFVNLHLDVVSTRSVVFWVYSNMLIVLKSQPVRAVVPWVADWHIDSWASRMYVRELMVLWSLIVTELAESQLARGFIALLQCLVQLSDQQLVPLKSLLVLLILKTQKMQLFRLADNFGMVVCFMVRCFRVARLCTWISFLFSFYFMWSANLSDLCLVTQLFAQLVNHVFKTMYL